MLKHNLHLRLAEIALIFAVFAIQGAWPVPDVNEPYYLGKAIHFWNRDWGAGDFFLESADTHAVFYFTFGWVSLRLSPAGLAWCGRLLTWGLLAWSWQRMSWVIVPRRWYALLSGGVFACLMERCHMAGEWVIGGIEAKGFAYVLVFLGLESMVRGRWNRTWLAFGGASLFHVLVGGWSAVAAAFAWWSLGRERPALRSMGWGLLGGLILSLPALVPSLALNWGTDAETIRRAHEIYVYHRLAHHLVFMRFPLEFILRFQLMATVFAALCLAAGDRPGERRLSAWVLGSLAIAVVGVLLSLAGEASPVWAAGLLRFYWFRLADVAVPLGVALLGLSWASRLSESGLPLGKWLGGAAAAIIGLHLASYAIDQPWNGPPRGDKRVQNPEWAEACAWVDESSEIPLHVRFLTPMESQTFRWRTQRAEVVARKDIPQDARSIVEWWRRMEEIYGTGSDDPENQWHASLTELGAERLRQLGAKYDAKYLLTEADPPLPLTRLYANRAYAVYQLTDVPSP